MDPYSRSLFKMKSSVEGEGVCATCLFMKVGCMSANTAEKNINTALPKF